LFHFKFFFYLLSFFLWEVSLKVEVDRNFFLKKRALCFFSIICWGKHLKIPRVYFSKYRQRGILKYPMLLFQNMEKYLFFISSNFIRRYFKIPDIVFFKKLKERYFKIPHIVHFKYMKVRYFKIPHQIFLPFSFFFACLFGFFLGLFFCSSIFFLLVLLSLFFICWTVLFFNSIKLFLSF